MTVLLGLRAAIQPLLERAGKLMGGEGGMENMTISKALSFGLYKVMEGADWGNLTKRIFGGGGK